MVTKAWLISTSCNLSCSLKIKITELLCAKFNFPAFEEELFLTSSKNASKVFSK
jgi:hypothetical protein